MQKINALYHGDLETVPLIRFDLIVDTIKILRTFMSENANQIFFYSGLEIQLKIEIDAYVTKYLSSQSLSLFRLK